MTDESALCRSKVGLLCLRDCNQPAVGTCEVCGRPICRDHQAFAAGKLTCPECAAGKKDAKDKGQVRWHRRRARYYHGYGYQPYYFGCHYYYSDHDYRSFDPGEAVQHEPADDIVEMDEGAGPDSDFSEMDMGES